MCSVWSVSVGWLCFESETWGLLQAVHLVLLSALKARCPLSSREALETAVQKMTSANNSTYGRMDSPEPSCNLVNPGALESSLFSVSRHTLFWASRVISVLAQTETCLLVLWPLTFILFICKSVKFWKWHATHNSHSYRMREAAVETQ